MKIENLKEGMKIKNYPELCKVLEIEKKTSNSKIKQFKDLGQFVHFEKEGRSFIIKEIYPHAKERKDGRKSIYEDRKLMELLIMDYLIDSKLKTVNVTRNQMLKHIQAINPNYSYCSANIPSFSRYAEIPEQIVYDFFNTTNSSFRSAFINALDNLRDKALIMYDVATTVSLLDEPNHRVATGDEKELILQIEKETLFELGFSKKSQARMSRKWLSFVSKTKSKLAEQSKIEFYYQSYEITVNRKFIKSEHNILLQEAYEQHERELHQSKLNLEVSKRLYDNAVQRKKKTDGKMAQYRVKKRYIDDNKKMIAMLIDKDSNVIVNDVRNKQDELDQLNEFMAEVYGKKVY